MVKLLETFAKQFGSFVCVSPYYGVSPYYAGEILRQIAGKVVIEATRNDVIVSVKILQVYVRHDADGEALVHSMRSMHNEEKTKTVLIVEGENAFNAVKRKAFLCNINIICPSIATLVHNCYSKPSRLLFIGGVGI